MWPNVIKPDQNLIKIDQNWSICPKSRFLANKPVNYCHWFSEPAFEILATIRASAVTASRRAAPWNLILKKFSNPPAKSGLWAKNPNLAQFGPAWPAYGIFELAEKFGIPYSAAGTGKPGFFLVPPAKPGSQHQSKFKKSRKNSKKK